MIIHKPYIKLQEESERKTKKTVISGTTKAESGSPENGAYYARYRCIHRQPTKEDTPYDF